MFLSDTMEGSGDQIWPTNEAYTEAGARGSIMKYITTKWRLSPDWKYTFE